MEIYIDPWSALSFVSIQPTQIDWQRYLDLGTSGPDEFFALLERSYLVPNYHSQIKARGTLTEFAPTLGWKACASYPLVLDHPAFIRPVKTWLNDLFGTLHNQYPNWAQYLETRS